MNKANWKNIAGKVNALSGRERLMILVTLFLLVQVLIILILNPVFNNHLQNANNKLNMNFKQIQTLSNDIFVRASDHKHDSDSAQLKRIANLKQQIENLDSNLIEISESFIEPYEMINLIKALLSKNNLEVERLENSPPVIISENNKTDSPENASIYKHGIHIKATGSYRDHIHFLTKLEKLPWHIFWREFHLTANQDGVSTIDLDIFTLNFGPTWLEL